MPDDFLLPARELLLAPFLLRAARDEELLLPFLLVLFPFFFWMLLIVVPATDEDPPLVFLDLAVAKLFGVAAAVLAVAALFEEEAPQTEAPGDLRIILLIVLLLPLAMEAPPPL